MLINNFKALFLIFRHNIPHLPDIKRIHTKRSQEADRANIEEAIRRQVLQQDAGRDGLRMTQARRQGAVSGHAGPRPPHAGPGWRGPSAGDHTVSVLLGLLDIQNYNGPRVGEAGVSVSESESRTSESESRTSERERNTSERESVVTRTHSCSFSGACACSQAPFSIYDGKINIPMNF